MAFKSLRGLSLENAANQLGMTRPKLMAALKERRIMMNSGLPYRQYIQQGLFVVDARSFTNIAGIEKQYAVTLVTGAGLAYLQELLNSAA